MREGTHAGPPGDRLTVEQWGELDDEDRRELVDGRLQEDDVPGSLHDLMIATLVVMLSEWVRSRAGFVLPAGPRYAVGADRGRIPDLTVYLDGRRPPPNGVVRTPPDIAVEVVSPTPRAARRDRVDKPSDYASFGVRQYWVLDPWVRSLEVYELGDDGRYRHALAAAEGTAEMPGCEGLTLDLDVLWAEADRLQAPGD